MIYRQGRIAPAFQETYDKLLAIRNKLEKLTLTQAWSLRETDLWDFQRQLDRVDEARVEGNFYDGVGRPAEIYEQRVSIVDVHLHAPKLTQLDIALPSTEELRPDIPTALDLGARLRSTAANLQPADDATEMLTGGQKARRRFFTTRALPI
jgi:hypothetical protein